MSKSRRLRHKNIFICSINTRTLSNEAYLLEFEKVINKINYDVIGLSEVKRIGENLIQRNGYFSTIMEFQTQE
jgi:hypothetical protein